MTTSVSISKSRIFDVVLYASIVLFYLASFRYAEKLQANQGLGWDGYRYANVAQYLHESKELDAYLIMRVIPSAWVHLVFKWLEIDFSPSNIIKGFEYINLIAILIGVFFTQKTMRLLNVQNRIQWFGVTLLILNYGLLKFVVY
jgi:hypothetical protein